MSDIYGNVPVMEAKPSHSAVVQSCLFVFLN